jgi:glycosyltransferase involved in cell wall biosynthesis
MLITFSGLDGAGKSTLIEWLRAALERHGHSVAVLHMNDDVGVYAYVRRARNRLLRLLGREVPRARPAGTDARNIPRPATQRRLRETVRRLRHAVVWSPAVRRCVYPIDLLFFAFYRLYLERLRKRVLIMDRYFYDTLVDVSVNGHYRWSRVLNALTPTPDVPVLVDVPPEQAFGRKGEHSVEYLRRRWTAYQRVLSWVPSSVKLPNVEAQRAQAALWRSVAARRSVPTLAEGIPSPIGCKRSADRAIVSVIVPCRNERRYIAQCLDSILATKYPLDRLEVLVVDGRSDDGTRSIVEGYAARHPVVQLLDNPRRITPTALNIGIRSAAGEIVLRMDAHLLYPPDYIPRLVAALEETSADNVGGVLVTLPADPHPVSRAIAVGLSHPFGVGNSYFRIGVRSPRWVDTVAFFCCRRELFDRIGMFDEDLVRHQDGELNGRLIKHGGRILLLPEVMSYYYARGSLRQVARMYFQYGYFKPLVARKLGRILTVRQMIPPLFLLSLFSTGILAAWVPAAAVLFGSIAGAYAAAVLMYSGLAARRHGIRCALALAAVFPVLHFSYGLGFFWRLFEFFALKRPRAHSVAELPLSR